MCVARKGEMQKAYNILEVYHQKNSSLGRSRCRWEDNIKINLREIGYKMDSIDLGWGQMLGFFE